MTIMECRLTGFGRFSDYTIPFHTGLNIIEGANEAGKSTVFAFIRAMLYGIRKSRSKNLDEYQLRQPWGNPDDFRGSMRVHKGDKIYRIERNFLQKDQSLTVVNETDGLEEEDPEAFLSELTGGMSESDFTNTFFFSQKGGETDDSLGKRIRDYLVSMEQTGGPGRDVGSALDYLKSRKRELEAEKKKAAAAVSEKMSENRRQADFTRAEISRLSDRIAAASQEDGAAAFVRRDVQAGETARTGRDPANGPSGLQIDFGPAKNTGSGGGPADTSGSTADTSGSPADTSGSTAEGKGKLLRLLGILLLPAAVLSALCSFFALKGISRILLAILAVVFLAGEAFLLRKLLREGRKDRAKNGQAADERIMRQQADTSQAEKDRKKLKKAEKSVERYSRLNKLLGYRDDSVDPDLERRKEKLDRQKEKTMQAEQDLAKDQTASDVAKILSSGKDQTASDVAKILSSGKNQALAGELREKRQQLHHLDMEFEKLSSEKGRMNAYDEDIQAVSLAAERITKLSSGISRETGEEFSARAADILSRLTGGAYSRISMDPDMQIRIHTPDRLLKIQEVSFGTREQIYFALRIAAGELLSGDAGLPVILDEPFSMYDERRLKEALTFLSGCGRQVILFTCQNREKRIASDL